MLRDEESEDLVEKKMSERTSEAKTSSPSSSSVGALVKTCAALAVVGLVALFPAPRASMIDMPRPHHPRPPSCSRTPPVEEGAVVRTRA